jgi:hypothetical protein
MRWLVGMRVGRRRGAWPGAVVVKLLYVVVKLLTTSVFVKLTTAVCILGY